MRRIGIIIVCGLLAFACEKERNSDLQIITGSFTDIRNGITYISVTIGDQVWMSQNLAYLPSVSPPEIGSDMERHQYVYAYSGSDIDVAKSTENYKIYGVLYNWESAMFACPDGWHLPSISEWNLLFENLQLHGFGHGGSGDDVAKALASKTGWASSRVPGSVGYASVDNNKSGFNALPGGHLPYNGIFADLLYKGFFWSSDEPSPYSPTAYDQQIDYISPVVNSSFSTKISAYSVRCVKD